MGATQHDKKVYAMGRMAQAIDRARLAESVEEQTRADRWIAVWGALCGIRAPGGGIALRRSMLIDHTRVRGHHH